MLIHTLMAAALLIGGSSSESPQPSPTPLEIADRLEQRQSNVTDYEFVMESRIEGEKSTREGRYRIWVRKPDLFRLKVEKGSHSGSTIAVNKKGKVRARPGGVLGKVVVKTMEKSDSRLRSPRGGYPWDSNFDSLNRKFRSKVANAKPHEIEIKTDESHQIQVSITFKQESTGKPLTEHWMIDTETWLLTGLDTYEDGRQVERIRYRDYQENLGLTESFFDR